MAEPGGAAIGGTSSVKLSNRAGGFLCKHNQRYSLSFGEYVMPRNAGSLRSGIRKGAYVAAITICAQPTLKYAIRTPQNSIVYSQLHQITVHHLTASGGATVGGFNSGNAEGLLVASGGVTAGGECSESFDEFVPTEYIFDGTFFLKNSSPTSLPTGNSARTMVGWVRPDPTIGSTIKALFGYGPTDGDSPGDNNYLLYNRNDQNDLSFWGSFIDMAGDASLNPGEWNFVAMTFDGTDLRLFINDYTNDQTGVTLSTTLQMIRVGLGAVWNAEREFLFEGDISTVGVWDRAFTVEEMNDYRDLGIRYYDSLPVEFIREITISDAEVSSQNRIVTGLEFLTHILSDLQVATRVPVLFDLEVASTSPVTSQLQVKSGDIISDFTILGDTILDVVEMDHVVTFLEANESVFQIIKESHSLAYLEANESVYQVMSTTNGTLNSSSGMLQASTLHEPSISALTTASDEILEFASAGTVHLKGFWNLSEESGTRYDSIGGNHLDYVLAGAEFSYEAPALVGSPTTFTDESPVAASWEWDFGDDETSVEQNPSHTYNSTGNYTVALVVDGVTELGTTHEIGVVESLLDEPMDGNELIGSLSGVAFYDTVNGYIRLTSAVNSQNGAVNYNTDYVLADKTLFEVTFDFWAFGGADAIWLHLYTSNTPTTENDSTVGYQIWFSEYQSKVAIRAFGGTVADAFFFNLGNGTWRTAKVHYDNQYISVYINDFLIVQYDDSGNIRDLSNTYMGLGGRTGAVNAEHRVKNLKIIG